VVAYRTGSGPDISICADVEEGLRMSAITVRPFRRSDREQLTELVNAHAAAVVPGLGGSVAAVLGALEHQGGEFIIGPWMSERVTLVAEQHGRVAAAAHLVRYSGADQVSPSYRGTGEIRWLLFWPEAPAGNPGWADGWEPARHLIAACLRRLAGWQVTREHAGGELPVRGVSGVPEQWPHVRALYTEAGFRHEGDTEVVYLAAVDQLPRPGAAPLPGLTVRRSVGINGTRLAADLATDRIGYIEVEIFDEGERLPRRAGWADVGNLHVAGPYRRRGVATWLLAQAAAWLRLAQVTRLLDYASLDDPGQPGGDPGYRAFLAAAGFTELTRTQRGWTRP
jgi:GNAT superfamily N-acetyltransferase